MAPVHRWGTALIQISVTGIREVERAVLFKGCHVTRSRERGRLTREETPGSLASPSGEPF